MTIEKENTMRKSGWPRVFVALKLNKLFPDFPSTVVFPYSGQSLLPWDTTWKSLAKPVYSVPWELLILKAFRVASVASVIPRHSPREHTVISCSLHQSYISPSFLSFQEPAHLFLIFLLLFLKKTTTYCLTNPAYCTTHKKLHTNLQVVLYTTLV